MAKAPASSTHAPAVTAALKPSLLGRVLAPLSSLRQRPVRAALIGLPVAIIGGVALWYSVSSGQSVEKATLEVALAKLQAHEYTEARRIAAEVRTGDEESFVSVGGAFYVLGAVMAEDAKVHENARERQTLHLIASRYLEESRLRGFPPEHESEGLLLLGRSLHHGGRFSASIPILKEALSKNSSAKGEILYLLADSHLHLNPPNLELAAAHARRLLAEKHLPQAERDQGLLLQGKIALAQRMTLGFEKFAEARKDLDKIGTKSSDTAAAKILSVRLLCAQMRIPPSPDTQALENAIASLETLTKQNHIAHEMHSQAELLIGICLEMLGKKGEAISQFARVRKTHLGSPEAVAAAIYAGDLLLRDDPAKAVELYKQGLTEAGPAETYHNDWLPKDEMQKLLQGRCETLLSLDHFPQAAELAAAFTPLFPEEQAYFWRARVEHEWGTRLLANGAKSHSPGHHAGRGEEHQAREHFRKAGAHFERLAELRIATKSYLDDLMDSARDYLAGQSYTQAIHVLRSFLKEDPEVGQEQARIGLGEALLASGQTEEGLKVLEEVIAAAPRHPSTYRARYFASQGYEELGKVAPARQQLVDNLYNFSLTPESSDWRDSLFLLGRIVYQEALAHEAQSRDAGVDLATVELRKPGLQELAKAAGLFQEAARILEEAVERFPSGPQTNQARYFLADAHRQAARWPRKRLDGAAVEATGGPLAREMVAELSAALHEYTLLIEKLSADQGSLGGSEVEQTILRNSYFAKADVLFDQGKIEEALTAYSAATSRYQHEPEALEAYLQIASCYRRLGRHAEARGTLEQARVVLARLKPETNFTKTTPYSRDEWTRLLTWLSAL